MWASTAIEDVRRLVKKTALSPDEVDALRAVAAGLLGDLGERRCSAVAADALAHSDFRHLDDEVLRLIVGALSPTDAFFAALTCCAIRNAIFSRFTSSKMAPHQRLACPRFTLAPSDVVASVARLRWMKAHLPAFCREQAELVCEEAARRGSLAILKEAREMGLAWDSSTCDAAAQSGNLAVLQWLRSQGCQWSEATCAQAALHGHLEVLQWMRAGLPSKERCPWDED
eukprot:852820-Prymnesium_polylepis.1